MSIDNELKCGPALAIYFEREGIRVIPLHSGAKTPKVGGFGAEFPDFTTPFDRFKDRDDVGVLCGPQPIWGGAEGDWYLMCLDIDGESPDPEWEVREFGARLPLTLTSKAGHHRWYRVGRYRREEIAQWVRLVEWSGGGVDLKWCGGYAAERGQWDPPLGRFELEAIAPLPTALVDRIIALGTASVELSDLPGVLGELARLWPRPKSKGGEGGCHAAALALGGILARHGVNAEDAERALLESSFWAQTGTDDRTEDVLSSIEAHAANRNVYGWPQLESVSPAKERAIARTKKRVERYLGRRRAALAPPVPVPTPDIDGTGWKTPRECDYRFEAGSRADRVASLAGMLKTRARDFPGSIYASAQTLVRVVGAGSRPLRADQLVSLISKGPERCLRPTKDGDWYKIDAPIDECIEVLMNGEWPGLPELRGVAVCPFLRADGTVCSMPGYDATSGWYLAEGSLELPAPVPAAPSGEDLERARLLLAAPWSDFMWESPAAALVAPSAVLSILAQAAVDNRVPMHAFDAPTMNVGKSLAASLVGRVACGASPDPVTWPLAEEEQGKYLASMAGKNPIFFIDNQRRNSVLASAPLERTLTTGGVRYRLLGTNEERTAKWSSVVLLTGNGLNFSEETARRTLKATITGQNEERAADGSWTIPEVESWCVENRGWLVWAGLTLLRGHAAAGRPGSAGRGLDSFPLWSRVVADALEWAYGARVIECKARSEGDESLILYDALLEALAACVGYDTCWGWEEILAATGPAKLGDPAAIALKSAVTAITEVGGKRGKTLPASDAERSGNDPHVMNSVTWGLLLARIGRFGDPRPSGTLRKVHTKRGNKFSIERPDEPSFRKSS